MRVILLGVAICHASALVLSSTVNLTMYHVNPATYSGISNMDLADLGGDAYFDIRGLGLPMFCRNSTLPPFIKNGTCENPEVFSSDLVITRVTVMVEDDYGKYGHCNICVDGSVPYLPRESCTIGNYVCVCKELWKAYICRDTRVGREDVNKTHNFQPPPGSGPYIYWNGNLAIRLGGYWYSTLSKGENKTWTLVAEDKRVNATCHKERLVSSIHALNPSCYQPCPQPHNITSDCYITCMFDTLLGPDARYKLTQQGGITGSEIKKLWLDAFEGCPAI
mmetsp:Transcript_38062/g.73720  ORF Transcript_38062/g.73720 Transcript_38062/m.73720 type:complete len:278 (+) Transcript_38062:35-868(+)